MGLGTYNDGSRGDKDHFATSLNCVTELKEKENTRRSGSVSGICSLARKIRSLPSMHHGNTSAPLMDSHQIRPPHSPSVARTSPADPSAIRESSHQRRLRLPLRRECSCRGGFPPAAWGRRCPPQLGLLAGDLTVTSPSADGLKTKICHR
ncbi:uncharacterized protein [Aegilops tauschii subsp. strangulata]|uniref:uncharacterized protein isoform X1 n=1 Tax=Aegilops tauschii subsp. strangulata TaxID=200361 RepID=UPI001ABCA39F|nr:uncharacterized protein LOC109744744 isoform X3 [Aegilops tauschii subsp. strangulata]